MINFKLLINYKLLRIGSFCIVYQYKHNNGTWCCAVSSTNPCCFPFRHLFSSATFNPLLSPQYYFIIRLSHKLYAVKKTCAISED